VRGLLCLAAVAEDRQREPNTRLWNRRTNAAEVSGSRAPKPASSDSSDSGGHTPVYDCAG
jgi:hypothetical protein